MGEDGGRGARVKSTSGNTVQNKSSYIDATKCQQYFSNVFSLLAIGFLAISFRENRYLKAL